MRGKNVIEIEAHQIRPLIRRLQRSKSHAKDQRTRQHGARCRIDGNAGGIELPPLAAPGP
jgi:hypothetical protein